MTCESSSTNVLELGELFITVVRPCFRMRPIVEKKTHLIFEAQTPPKIVESKRFVQKKGKQMQNPWSKNPALG